MMHAITILEPGGPQVLQWIAHTMPEPAPEEVLIRVVCAGVNRPDIAQRKGHYPAPPGAVQNIPGLEVSGIIESVGQNVTHSKVGDQVCALLSGGGYSEYVCAPEGQLLPIPSGYSFEQAAALPETVLTVWHNVFQRGKLKQNETILIHGGTSGIGVMAIQMARAAGAVVIATAGSDEKCEKCLELGATRAINYRTQDFKNEVNNFTNRSGVDLILDMVGGDYTQKNLDCLAPDGRLVLINFMAGREANINLASVLTKRLTITGSTLRSRDLAFKRDLTIGVREKVWPWLEQGLVKPVIDSSYPMKEAAAAHIKMESSTHIGKIILRNG
jgi:NADPH2:quinone reductase